MSWSSGGRGSPCVSWGVRSSCGGPSPMAKTPRALTRVQAWRRIARKLLNQGRCEAGLCHEVSVLGLRDVIEWGTYSTMKAQILEHIAELAKIGEVMDGYAYGAHGGRHEERAMAALWMAHEAEEVDEPVKVLLREVYEAPVLSLRA